MHRAFGKLYSRGRGLFASPLPFCGPAEGSILDFFEPTSRGAKQPIFSPRLLGDHGRAISPAQR